MLHKLAPHSTALVLIDLQQGILGFGKAPRPGTEALATAATLAKRFREVGAPVVLVRVGWSADFGDALQQPVDQPAPRTPGGLPADWWTQPAVLEVSERDIQIVKRQWNAFHGTELDLQLRRRGVDTIVLAGISTNIGVESTARAAYEHGYTLVLAEDAMSCAAAEHHDAAVRFIFPRIGLVRQSAEVLAALGSDQ
ncbi:MULTISPECIES: hydrolase [Cupriavidus]|uniref:Hydrolase n=1 Tax=Cupriavidus pauculus TaxID=82633 RepID=A0A5P2HAA0_9BURK|nr:hydrolase [Cupriavidus pauculus]QET04926.1 hydrolase [Cupriavidus pauculus]